MPVLDKKYDGQSSANNASVKTGSSLAAAMVWLTTQLIECFAAYGQAMYPHPGYTESGELLDDRGRDRTFEERRWHEMRVLWVHADNPWVREHLLRPAREAELLATPVARDD